MTIRVITAYFTNSGTPATGLTPTIRMWEVTNTTDTLIVNNDPLTEVGDGFYKYVFTNYDTAKDYLIRIDGGVTLPTFERYSAGSNVSVTDDVASKVYNATKTDFTAPNTFGELLNNMENAVIQIGLDVGDILALVELLVKYESNRTRIDKISKTLTVYDDDGTTPLQVFNLKDSTGAASVAEVCERVPI